MLRGKVQEHQVWLKSTNIGFLRIDSSGSQIEQNILVTVGVL